MSTACCDFHTTIEVDVSCRLRLNQTRLTRFRKEEMVDVMIFAMVIASVVSLLVVSPRHAQREALRALRDDSEIES
jgi:hypothetical protein